MGGQRIDFPEDLLSFEAHYIQCWEFCKSLLSFWNFGTTSVVYSEIRLGVGAQRVHLVFVFLIKLYGSQTGAVRNWFA